MFLDGFGLALDLKKHKFGKYDDLFCTTIFFFFSIEEFCFPEERS